MLFFNSNGNAIQNALMTKENSGFCFLRLYLYREMPTNPPINYKRHKAQQLTNFTSDL
jgi:methionyl-tRNA synthetase